MQYPAAPTEHSMTDPPTSDAATTTATTAFVKRYRWYLAALVAVAVVLGIVAAAGGFGAGSFTMTGTLILVDQTSLGASAQVDKAPCEGTGGFSDLSPGTAVLVQDSTGQTLATGSLGAGAREATSGACLMPFTVPAVKDGLSSYSVTISHRGTQVVSAADAHGDVILSITG